MEARLPCFCLSASDILALAASFGSERGGLGSEREFGKEFVIFSRLNFGSLLLTSSGLEAFGRLLGFSPSRI